jgi:hypothetical protein
LQTATATATPTCAPGWTVVSSPNSAGGANGLNGVAAVSANDVWAVGSYYSSATASTRTLIERWDGSQWSIVPSPNVGAGNNALSDVAVVSPTDIWAVGSYSGATGYQTLTLRWDGSSWSIVPSPNSNSINYLSGVSAVSANDVWAVGNHHSCSSCSKQSLIEHWDGSNWSIVPSPNASYNNYVFDVDAVSGSDVWAVGYYTHCEGCVGYNLVLRWNGTTWALVAAPNTGPSTNSLYGVAAVNANDVWSVGQRYDGNYWHTLVLRWNGAAWNIVPSPTVGGMRNNLYDVTVVSENDVWAVGSLGDGNQTLTLHWDGIGWDIVPSPNPAANSYLLGVTAFSENDVWAVGGAGPQTLVERFRRSCATPTPTSTASPTVTNTPTRTPTPCPMSFTDVSASDYFYEAVRYLYCRGVVSGYSDSTFRPYNTTTRSQLAKIIVLAEGWPIYGPPTPTFRDVPIVHPFYVFVETAYRFGIVSGYTCGPGCLEFRPGNDVTRAQLCKIIVEAEEWSPNTTGGPHFRDVSPEDPFYAYIETAYNRDVISGYSCGPGCLEFRPGNSATRGQICKIVYNAVTQP